MIGRYYSFSLHAFSYIVLDCCLTKIFAPASANISHNFMCKSKCNNSTNNDNNNDLPHNRDLSHFSFYSILIFHAIQKKNVSFYDILWFFLLFLFWVILSIICAHLHIHGRYFWCEVGSYL